MAKRKSRKQARVESAARQSNTDIPLWLIGGSFVAVTLILFRDFVFGSGMLFGSDTEAVGYTLRKFFADSLRDGVFPRWNPLLFGGTPFLESLAGGDSLYPPSVLLLMVMPLFRALGWKLVIHLPIAAFGMYAWARCLGRTRSAAFVAGLGFMVAPFFVTLVFPGHDGKMFVTALTPWLFWAVERFFSTGSTSSWAAVGFGVALVTLTTHFQMAYFLFGAVGLYAALRTVMIQRSARREDAEPRMVRRLGATRFGLFLTASVVGAGAAGIQLLPAMDYIRADSRRSATTTEASAAVNKQYAAQFSMHAEEALASLIIPEFVGNTQANAGWAQGTYWGKNIFKLNHEYIGWILVMLACFSVFGAEGRGIRLFMLALFGVSFLYTLGATSPVWNGLYHTLPGIKLFRSASMVIFLSGFAVATLAAYGTDQVLSWARGVEPVPVEALRLGMGLVGLTALLLVGSQSGILLSVWTSLFHSDMGPDELASLARARPFIIRGAFVSFAFSAAVGGLVRATAKQRLGPVAITAMLAVAVAVDGARIDAPFITTRDFEAFSAPGPAIRALVEKQRTETPFRVFDFNRGGQETRAAMFGLELVTGHHPNDMARYRELIGMRGGGLPENLLGSMNVMRMLNVRYLIWPVRQVGALEGATPIAATQLADGSMYEAVYRIDDLPRARLVANAVVRPPEAAVSTLIDPAFDITTTVVVEEPLALELGGGDVVGNVDWVTRSPHESRLNVQADRNSILVIARNYYPAWKAVVDGVEVPTARVNHALLGIPLAAGSHDVVLSYESDILSFSLVISIACLLILAVLAWSRSFGAYEPVSPKLSPDQTDSAGPTRKAAQNRFLRTQRDSAGKLS